MFWFDVTNYKPLYTMKLLSILSVDVEPAKQESKRSTGATAFATGLLVGGAMACALGWGNGIGWGLGGGYGYSYDEMSLEMMTNTGDPGIHNQHSFMNDHDMAYDCGDTAYDIDASACDFGAVF